MSSSDREAIRKAWHKANDELKKQPLRDISGKQGDITITIGAEGQLYINNDLRCVVRIQECNVIKIEDRRKRKRIKNV